MDRRSFLRILSGAIATSQLDVEKLLWVPGQKTFFLPTVTRVSCPRYSDFVSLELERIARSLKIQNIFDRDDIFYTALDEKLRESPNLVVNGREMRIPLITKPESK